MDYCSSTKSLESWNFFQYSNALFITQDTFGMCLNMGLCVGNKAFEYGNGTNTFIQRIVVFSLHRNLFD